MALDLGPDWEQDVAQARAELAALTPRECIECAALVRDVKPLLQTPGSIALAERLARTFETQAAGPGGHAS